MEFLTTVCMAAIAAALFRLLVPESKFTKQISLLIACVFVLVTINAVTGAELSPDTDQYNISGDTDYIGFSGDVNRALQKKICTDMKNEISAVLSQNDIFPEQIHINVNISGLYSISITQVKLVFPEGKEADSQRASELLSEILPQEIELKTEIKR